MKILLTNDDGYDAENLKNLYQKLSKDHEVWIVAPKNNCSGMSAAISYLKEIEVIRIDERIYAVDGTPADCSYLGLLSIVDFEFDIVISGINHGANIGNDVIYSGTVLGLIHFSFQGETIRTPLGAFGNHSDVPTCEKFQESFDADSYPGHYYKGYKGYKG